MSMFNSLGATLLSYSSLRLLLCLWLVAFVLVAPALAQSPSVTEYSTRASALIARGKFYEAEQWYRLALREESRQTSREGSAELRLALAGVLARQGPHSASAHEARMEFESLLKELPESVAVVAGAAAGYSFLGESNLAGKLFGRAAELAPDDRLRSIVLRNRATILLGGEDVAEGICSSSLAYEVAPSAGEAAAHVSELSRLGRLGDAIAFGEQALAAVGGNPELLNRIAAAYIARDDCTRALPLLRRVLESGRAPEEDRKNAEGLSSACEDQGRTSLVHLTAPGSWPIQFPRQ